MHWMEYKSEKETTRWNQAPSCTKFLILGKYAVSPNSSFFVCIMGCVKDSVKWCMKRVQHSSFCPYLWNVVPCGHVMRCTALNMPPLAGGIFQIWLRVVTMTPRSWRCAGKAGRNRKVRACHQSFLFPKICRRRLLQKISVQDNLSQVRSA